MERKSKNIFCIEYWMLKSDGNVDQAKQLLTNFQRRDLKFFVEKYGEQLGEEKYSNLIANRSKRGFYKYSKSSQVFIEDFLKELCLDKTGLYYGKEE